MDGGHCWSRGAQLTLGREDPAVEKGGEDATMGPGWTMGGDHTTLGAYKLISCC